MFEGDKTVLFGLTNAVATLVGDPGSAALTILEFGTNQPQADLSIIKIGGPEPAQAGQDILYTISVFNAGPSYASNVVVTDLLPTGVTFDGSSPDAQTNLPNHTISLGDLPPGGSGVATLAALTASVGQIVNIASVTSDTPDPDTNNNIAIATNTVVTAAPPVDAAVAIATSSPLAQPGVPFTYTITVSNLGPGLATGVELDNSLPVNYSVSSLTASQGTASVAGPQLTALFGSLSAGASAGVVVTGTTSNLDTVQDVAMVNITQSDTNPANDIAVSETSVAQAPQIAIQPGDISTFCGHYAQVGVVAEGSQPLSYQWMANGSQIPGETNDDLDLGQVFLANDDNQYSVVVSNPYGSATSSNATLNVIDVDPPELLVPDTITAFCAGIGGAPVSYTVTATDDCDGSLTPLICVPPSGSLFPLGSNWVQCSAINASGNAASSGFAIIVQDTNSPIIIVPPSAPRVSCGTNGGAVVNYAVTASEDCDPRVTLVTIPPSGTVFPLGDTNR